MTIPRSDPPPTETPTPRTPRSEPDASHALASGMSSTDAILPVSPTAPLDVRVMRLEVRQELHDKQLTSLTSSMTTLHQEFALAKSTLDAASAQLARLAAQYEGDQARTMRELGFRAAQDSIHDEKHAQAQAVHAAHKAELVEVKRRLTWRQITQEAASRGVAGGLVFGAGLAWHELWPLLVELAKKAVGP